MVTLDMLLLDSCQLNAIPDTCLYHLTTDVISPDTRHATTGHLLLLCYPLSLVPCCDMTCHLPNITSCHAITWYPTWRTWLL